MIKMRLLFPSTLSLWIIISIIFLACNKEESNPVVEEAEVPSNPSYTVFTYTNDVSDARVSVLHFTERNLDFNFFGDKNSSGEIVKIKAVTINTIGNEDTICNFIIDDYNRVKTAFFTFNGVNDTTILKCSYQDSVTVVGRYSIFSDNIAILRQQIAFKNINYAYVAHTNYLMQMNNNSTLVRLAKDGVIAFLGGLIMVEAYAIGTPIVLGLGLYTGLSLIIHAASDAGQINTTNINIIKDIIDLLIPSSDASESDNIPIDGIVNPYFRQSEIDDENGLNEDWTWCSCVAKFVFPVWPMQYGGYFNDTSDIRNEHIEWGSIGPSPCGGSNGSPVQDAHFFQLRPGASVIYTFYIAPYCPEDSYYTRSENFTCE